MLNYRLVPIAAIDLPKKWRSVKKKTVAELMLSLTQDGLLQPIGLRPGVKSESHLLVYGRHRLEAARRLGWTEIEAKVLEIDATAAESATNAENLFRNNLTPGDRVLALKSWSERYRAEHPEVDGRGPAAGRQYAKQLEAAKVGAAAEEAPARFDEHASRQTGLSMPTVREYVAAGKNLSDEEMGVLAERAVPLVQIKAIGRLAPEPRARAVALVASGLAAPEALAQATLPANATLESVGDPAAVVKSEDDLDDDAWLDTYCGAVLARLKFPHDYRKDALLYRQSREMRQKLKNASKRLLKQSHVQTVGPFFMKFASFVNVEHPSKWLPCGPCGGTGMCGDMSQCGHCHGHAYTLKGGRR